MAKCTTILTMRVVSLVKKSGTLPLIRQLLSDGGVISEANALSLFTDIFANLCDSSVCGDTLAVIGLMLGKTADEVGEMDIKDTFAGLKEFAKENNLLDFFRQCFTSETP